MKIKLTEKSLDRVALPAGKPQLIVWDNEVPGFGVVVGRPDRPSSPTTGPTGPSAARSSGDAA
jgi:hypothetical protein